MSNENLSEKVSVNINTSTLSNIDILVDNGYYSNRSDFINQALREGLQKHQNTLDRIIERNTSKSNQETNHWFVGVYGLTKSEVDSIRERGKSITITGYGVLGIDEDIEDESLFAAVKSIKIKGKAVCRKSIKEHYHIK